MSEYSGEKSELAISLDVIYHLVEDRIFDQYMQVLFDAAHRYVIIYSSNRSDVLAREDQHVRHRQFTAWIQNQMPQWVLRERVPNKYPYRGNYRKGSLADFFVYQKA